MGNLMLMKLNVQSVAMEFWVMVIMDMHTTAYQNQWSFKRASKWETSNDEYKHIAGFRSEKLKEAAEKESVYLKRKTR